MSVCRSKSFRVELLHQSVLLEMFPTFLRADYISAKVNLVTLPEPSNKIWISPGGVRLNGNIKSLGPNGLRLGTQSKHC